MICSWKVTLFNQHLAIMNGSSSPVNLNWLQIYQFWWRPNALSGREYPELFCNCNAVLHVKAHRGRYMLSKLTFSLAFIAKATKKSTPFDIWRGGIKLLSPPSAYLVRVLELDLCVKPIASYYTLFSQGSPFCHFYISLQIAIMHGESKLKCQPCLFRHFLWKNAPCQYELR